MARQCLNCLQTRAEVQRQEDARSMRPCPVERLQAGWAGRQGFTTTSHAWEGKGAQGRCIHCHQTRDEASRPEESAKTAQEPWRAIVGGPWACVTRRLSSSP
jgi:hypothetical protein